jgi:hypothetical protein
MGAEARKPKVIVILFGAAEGTDGGVNITSRVMTCPGNCGAPNAAYFLGVHETIDKAIQSDPSKIRYADETHLRALIDLEYASRPDVVGGPVSLIRTSAAGPVFVDPGACVETLRAKAETLSVTGSQDHDPLGAAIFLH